MGDDRRELTDEQLAADWDLAIIKKRVDNGYEGYDGERLELTDLRTLLAHSEALALRLEGAQREREKFEKHADEGWKLANHRTRQWTEARLERAEARLRLEEVTRLVREFTEGKQLIGDCEWPDGSGRPCTTCRALTWLAALPASPVPLGLLKSDHVPYPANQTPEAAATAESVEMCDVCADCPVTLMLCNECSEGNEDHVCAPTTSQTVKPAETCQKCKRSPATLCPHGLCDFCTVVDPFQHGAPAVAPPARSQQHFCHYDYGGPCRRCGGPGSTCSRGVCRSCGPCGTTSQTVTDGARKP